MKNTLILFFLSLIVFRLPAFSAGDDETEKKPNLLFIFPDQFRVQSMGFMNEDPVITPNLDKLASQGVVFTNAVSNRPLCSPYRAMLMTGKYPFSNGVQTNCNTSSRKYRNYLREDETCLSDILSQNGYHSGYIGKWHLDAPTKEEGPDVDDWRDAVWESYTPPGAKRHHFEFWHAYGCNNRHNDPYYWVNDASVEDTLFAKKWSPEHEADVAIDFIASNTDKPWALFVSMNPPHGPYHEVPEKYKKIYQNTPIDSLLNRPNVPEGESGDVGRRNIRDYFACVTGVDEQFGRIMTALEETGQSENTIVIFTSDHGEMMGSHGLLQKVVWYEESFRVPFIMRWPKKMRAGINDLHLSVPDLMPTLLAMIGLEHQIPEDVEGENLQEAIMENSDEKPEFSLYLNCSQNNLRGGMRGLRNDQYTFVWQKDKEGKTTSYLLFDHQNDPYQLTNIADEQTELIKDLKRALLVKLEGIQDPWVK